MSIRVAGKVCSLLLTDHWFPCADFASHSYKSCAATSSTKMADAIAAALRKMKKLI
jgi:hypothetical protein